VDYRNFTNVNTLLVLLLFTISLLQPMDSKSFFVNKKLHPNIFYCSSAGTILGIQTVSIYGGNKAFQILLHVHCRVSQWHYDGITVAL